MSQQIRIRTAYETAYIRTVERLTAQSQCQAHRYTGFELFPTTLVVASPCSCITMSSQEVTTTQHERTFIRIRQQKTVTTGAYHIETIYIVETQVRTFRHAFTTAMDVVLRHGNFRTVTNGRFVHIVPNTINAMRHERHIKGTPPTANFRTGKIREMTRSRPYLTYIMCTISLSYPIILFCSFVVQPETLFYLDTRVNHVDTLEILGMQIGIQFFRIRESLRIKSENLELVHVMNIHPDNITRTLVMTQSVCDLLHTSVRIITESTLLIPQCPHRRQFHVTCQIDQCLHQSLRGFFFNDHHSESRTCTGKHNFFIGSHFSTPCIVGNDTESRTVWTQSHHPRMTLIKMCTIVHTIIRIIHVPEFNGLSVASERTPNFTATIKIDILSHLESHHLFITRLTINRANLPIGRNFTDGIKLSFENRRRSMCRRIILGRIEHCHSRS